MLDTLFVTFQDFKSELRIRGNFRTVLSFYRWLRTGNVAGIHNFTTFNAKTVASITKKNDSLNVAFAHSSYNYISH